MFLRVIRWQKATYRIILLYKFYARELKRIYPGWVGCNFNFIAGPEIRAEGVKAHLA